MTGKCGEEQLRAEPGRETTDTELVFAAMLEAPVFVMTTAWQSAQLQAWIGKIGEGARDATPEQQQQRVSECGNAEKYRPLRHYVPLAERLLILT